MFETILRDTMNAHLLAYNLPNFCQHGFQEKRLSSSCQLNYYMHLRNVCYSVAIACLDFSKSLINKSTLTSRMLAANGLMGSLLNWIPTILSCRY